MKYLTLPLLGLGLLLMRSCGGNDPHALALRDGYLRNTANHASSPSARIVVEGHNPTLELENGDNVKLRGGFASLGKTLRGVRISNGNLFYYDGVEDPR